MIIIFLFFVVVVIEGKYVMMKYYGKDDDSCSETPDFVGYFPQNECFELGVFSSFFSTQFSYESSTKQIDMDICVLSVTGCAGDSCHPVPILENSCVYITIMKRHAKFSMQSYKWIPFYVNQDLTYYNGKKCPSDSYTFSLYVYNETCSSQTKEECVDVVGTNLSFERKCNPMSTGLYFIIGAVVFVLIAICCCLLFCVLIICLFCGLGFLGKLSNLLFGGSSALTYKNNSSYQKIDGSFNSNSSFRRSVYKQ